MLPEIGFGTWRYRGGLEPLKAAIEHGARFIDTAESYGSEPVVGQAIRGLRQSLILATKVSPRHFRHADVLQAADRSLKRLGTDYIDLYQLHWPNHTVPIQETMSAMERLVDAGKVRFIGVSNFSLRELKAAQRALSKYRIVSNQVRYNLRDRTIEVELLDYCDANQITVIAHSPLGGSWSQFAAEDGSQALQAVAGRTGKTAAQIALNWCLAPARVVAIPKSDSVAHVIENCAASGWRLSTGDLAELNTEIPFRCRSRIEIRLRQMARYCSQKLGRNL